jgi:putative thioredoxin
MLTHTSESHEIQDFESDVIQRSHQVPVVVDFWAEWCGPCRILGPILERLEREGLGRWALSKLDTDRHQDIAAEYGIRGIPNVKLFIKGQVVAEFTGAQPESAVRKWLEKHVPRKSSRELEEARALLSQDRHSEAREIFERIVASDPGNSEAKVLLARDLVRDDPAVALNLISGIEEDSEHFPLSEALRTIVAAIEKRKNSSSLPDGSVTSLYLSALDAVSNEEYDSALGQLIEIIRLDREYDDDGSRKLCIAIFRYLGEDHEITRRHRRDFAGALTLGS